MTGVRGGGQPADLRVLRVVRGGADHGRSGRRRGDDSPRDARGAREAAASPPFDLAKSGFTNHYAFVGERTVVFVFEGAEAREHLQDLTKRLPMKELARMGMPVHDPELLTERLSWADGVGICV
jgi:hypothetical protein